jgi:hypothetical protein
MPPSCTRVRKANQPSRLKLAADVEDHGSSLAAPPGLTFLHLIDYFITFLHFRIRDTGLFLAVPEKGD